jgi:hypothetical protein
MMMNFQQISSRRGEMACHARFMAWACLLLVSWGCGAKDQVKVTGTVSWNAEPVSRGYITFFSAPLVPAGGGPIEDGQFKFLSKPGKVSVQVTASREGKYDPGEKAIAREQYIPPKYNRDTTLTADVTLEGQNEFEFALVQELKK